MMGLPAALGLVKRFWWAIPILGLVIALFITRHTLERRTEALEGCKTVHAQFVTDVKAKTELARLSDAAHAARVERDQNQVAMETDNEIRHRINAAVAAVRVRNGPQADPSGSRGADMSSAPISPGSPSGASASAIVPADDLTICATNTVLSEGWQSWWKQVQAVER